MRRRLLTSALSCLALTAAVGPAVAEPDTWSVLAYGHDVDGVCTFDAEPLVPAGNNFRVDDGCRLLIQPISVATGFELSAPSPHWQYKRDATDELARGVGAGGIGGGGGVNLERAGDAVTAANDLAAEASASSSSRVFEASALMFGIDTLARPIYRDVMRFRYLRRADGSMSGFQAVPGQAYCATAGAPTTVDYEGRIHDCFRFVSAAGANKFEFDSVGVYSARLSPTGTIVDPGRKMQAHFLTFKSGFSIEGSYCGFGGSWPPGWHAGQCRLEDLPVR